jgi:pantothenate kinase-related protein Tda10
MEVVYRPSVTMKAYHKDDSFVRLLVGPIGSGKSVASVIEMLLKSFNQQPDSTGRRCTRWAIIRTAYRLL